MSQQALQSLPLSHSPALPLFRSSRYHLIAILLTLLIGAAITPTLPWQEFSSSMENLNVATAQEIRRTGNWLVPTLQGQTRLQKPPLTAWMTAAVIGDGTMQAISSADFDRRDRGFNHLAWLVRGEALVLGCATVYLTFLLGWMLFDDPELGLVSLIVMGSSLLFLRFTRCSSTDVPLMLWVTAGNLLLLLAVIKGRWWLGCIGAGAALALAMLTKGPVCLVQSIVPIAAFLVLERFRRGDSDWPSLRNIRIPSAPVIVGVATFLVLGLAWYAMVFLTQKNAWQIWKLELVSFKEPETHTSHWYGYFTLPMYMAPWSVFFFVGLIVACLRRASRDLLVLMMLIVPLFIMSFFRDRYERYMLPMLPAAAILTAMAVVEVLRAARRAQSDRVVIGLHWIIVAGIGIGFPIVASTALKRLDGNTWIAPPVAVEAAVFATAIIGIAMWFGRRVPWALVVGSMAIMLGTQELFMAGYAQTRAGRADFRPLAEQIWSSFPDAQVFNAHPRGKRPPPEMGVYLNRVLKWIADPSRLEPGPQPKVLLMLQDTNEPAPTPPPGWIFLGKKLTKGEGWWAFVMPRTEGGRSDGVTAWGVTE